VTQWLNKAVELESRKDWPAMLEHSRRWTQAQPGSGMAWFSLGIAYKMVGQSAKAIEAYQQALRINPEDAGAWYQLGHRRLRHRPDRQGHRSLSASPAHQSGRCRCLEQLGYCLR
jgi:tetratricopeptide (TPR) repeat protein